MVICKYHQQGRCKYGANCRYEHIDQGGNNRSKLDQKPAKYIISDFKTRSELIAEDLRLKPQWPFTTYGPEIRQMSIIINVDVSAEEVRAKAYEMISMGRLREHEAHIASLLETVKMKQNWVQTHPQRSLRLLVDLLNQKKRGDCVLTEIFSEKRNTQNYILSNSENFLNQSQQVLNFSNSGFPQSNQKNNQISFSQTPSQIYETKSNTSPFLTGNQKHYEQSALTSQSQKFIDNNLDKVSPVGNTDQQSSASNQFHFQSLSNLPVQNNFERSSAQNIFSQNNTDEIRQPNLYDANIFRSNNDLNAGQVQFDVVTCFPNIPIDRIYQDNSNLCQSDSDKFKSAGFVAGQIPLHPPPAFFLDF